MAYKITYIAIVSTRAKTRQIHKYTFIGFKCVSKFYNQHKNRQISENYRIMYTRQVSLSLEQNLKNKEKSEKKKRFFGSIKSVENKALKQRSLVVTNTTIDFHSKSTTFDSINR